MKLLNYPCCTQHFHQSWTGPAKLIRKACTYHKKIKIEVYIVQKHKRPNFGLKNFQLTQIKFFIFDFLRIVKSQKSFITFLIEFQQKTQYSKNGQFLSAKSSQAESVLRCNWYLRFYKTQTYHQQAFVSETHCSNQF